MFAPSAPRFPGRGLAWLWRLLVLLALSTWAAGCASLPANVQRTPSRAFDAPDDTALGRLVQDRRAQSRARSDSGFLLLDSVDSAFSSRLALIEGAQRTLDLQYYAIHADASTAVLLERMRAAARRGVRIRLLLDDFNSVGEDAQVLRLAFEPGIEMRLFNPLTGPRGSLLGRVLGSLHDVEGMQKRMHNKLFIADNAWGITGGRNLGDAYFGGDGKSSFVDLDVLAAGRVVRDMSASFDRYWNDELAYPVQALLDRQDLERMRKESPGGEESPGGKNSQAPQAAAQPAAIRPASTVLPNVEAADVASAERPPMDLRRVPLVWAPSLLLADKPGKIGPGDDEANAGETVVDGLLQLMQGAQRELLVISPYFVPGEAMMEQFAQLRRRGVAIRVLTNSLASNDAPAAHAGYRRYRRELLAMGVELHEMRADPSSAQLEGAGSGPGSARGKGGSGVSLGSTVGGSKSGTSRASLHSKAVIIDRRLSVIGSMNLDLRSQLKNSEVALVIRSPALAQAGAALIERSFAHGAYRLEMADGGDLRWRAPPGAPFQDATSEPEAPLKLRMLVNLLAPFAPDEML